MSGTNRSRFVTAATDVTNRRRFVTPAHEVRAHTGVRDWTACGLCGGPLEYYARPLEERRGRTPNYCGGACRQAAHRLRERVRRTGSPEVGS